MGVIFLLPDSPCARDQRDEQEWDERAQITPSKAAFTPPQIKREYRRQYHRRWLARDCGGETRHRKPVQNALVLQLARLQKERDRHQIEHGRMRVRHLRD